MLDVLQRFHYSFSRPYRLDLSNMALPVLTELIAEFHHITELSLCHNKLSTVPCEMGYLTALTSLDLSYNRLQWDQLQWSQKAAFESLSSLTMFDIGHNTKLVALPPAIGTLPLIEIQCAGIPKLRSPPQQLADAPVELLKHYLAQIHEFTVNDRGRPEILVNNDLCFMMANLQRICHS